MVLDGVDIDDGEGKLKASQNVVPKNGSRQEPKENYPGQWTNRTSRTSSHQSQFSHEREIKSEEEEV